MIYTLTHMAQIGAYPTLFQGCLYNQIEKFLYLLDCRNDNSANFWMKYLANK